RRSSASTCSGVRLRSSTGIIMLGMVYGSPAVALRLLNHNGLEEGDGLDAGDFKALAAADVAAADEVVGADHVALGFGEAGAVALVGAAGELGFFAADDPADGILIGLAAVRAGERMGALLGALVEECAFFHGQNPSRSSAANAGARSVTRNRAEEKYRTWDEL